MFNNWTFYQFDINAEVVIPQKKFIMDIIFKSIASIKALNTLNATGVTGDRH